ncbi:hypothetical protein ABFS83_08G193000 [Erythranthe nasuta]
MDESRNPNHIGEKNNDLLFNDHHTNFLEFTHKQDELVSQNYSLANLMHHSLLFGAEKMLMARKSGPFVSSELEHQNGNDIQPNNNSIIKGQNAPKQNNNVSHELTNIESFVVFLPVLVFKVTLFQTNLIVRFFFVTVWFFDFFFMFMMFPFRTLIRIRDHAKKKLRRALVASYSRLISFAFCNGLRLGMAVFRATYVFFVLVMMLISSFAISGIIMRNLVEEPIHTTEILNFDYTKTSPVSFVPIASSSGLIVYEITCKCIFRLLVRVESLSADGKVIFGSSSPTMLRFKSRKIHTIETLLNVVPLITGLKSEVQNLKIVMRDDRSKEGYAKRNITTCFKVVLERRAEFLEAGSGVPEIYGATLEISSELPRLKNLMSSWRRTIFVWISFAFFGGEIVILLLVCRHVMTSKNKSWPDKFTWEKTGYLRQGLVF